MSIPFSIAAKFYMDMKKFAEYDPPDETGGLEGQFQVDVGTVVNAIQAAIENELTGMLAYTVYAQSLRGTQRDGIADEFEAHAADELEHAEFLLRRAAVLGGAITFNDIPAPPPDTDPESIVRTMIRIEQEGLAKWRALHALMGENPMKYEIESYMVVEQHHLDELWQLLPFESRAALLKENPAPAASPPPAEKAAELDPRTVEFLAGEEEARGGEQVAELDHLREAMRQAGEELGLLRQQQAQTAQQAEQLSQQVQQAQAQAQAAQAQAIQEVTSAHDVALQRGMEAAQNRIAFQNLRGQLLSLGSQEPPSPMLNVPPPEAQMGGGTADAMAGASGAQQPGPQEQEPGASSTPASNVQVPQQDPAGAQGGTPGQQMESSGSGRETVEETRKTTKESAANPMNVIRAIRDRPIGAGVGALAGGALAGLDAMKQSPEKLEEARRLLAELEAAHDRAPGVRSGLALMGAKGGLARREFSAAHPVGAALLGSLSGAVLGANTQKSVESVVDSTRRLMKLPQEVG